MFVNTIIGTFAKAQNKKAIPKPNGIVSFYLQKDVQDVLLLLPLRIS